MKAYSRQYPYYSGVTKRGDTESLKVVKKSLDEFRNVSGLFPNLSKNVIQDVRWMWQSEWYSLPIVKGKRFGWVMHDDWNREWCKMTLRGPLNALPHENSTCLGLRKKYRLNLKNDIPPRDKGYKATTSGIYQRNNANLSYQERRQSMEETLSKFMGESTKRHEVKCNLTKEIRASTDAAIWNQGGSIKTLEIQIKQMSKLISTIVEADTSSICRMGSYQYVVSIGQNSTLMYETKQTTIPFLSRLNDCYCEDKNGSYGPLFSEAYSYEASHIDKSIPQKEKDPGSFTLPCYINNVCFNNALADLGTSISAMPLSTNLNLGTSSSTPAISSEVAELKDMARALLLDKKNQSPAPTPSTTPAPVKAVKSNCVTCGGSHSYQNCPATQENAYRYNIQEYVSQAATANYNQGNTGF
nr:hypothetical protein [Tanacetum cinerariifolium]